MGFLVRSGLSMQETATQALTRTVRDGTAPAASDEQLPCISCAGAPCVNSPCQLPDLRPGARPADQTAAAAALSQATLDGHSAALDLLTESEREARLLSEQHARNVHAEQVAAEEARRAEDVANAVIASEASANVAQAAEYRNGLDEVASRAAEQTAARESRNFVATVAASEAQDVMDAVRAQEAAIARDAFRSAARAATASFVNRTATFVNKSVLSGALNVTLAAAYSRSNRSNATAQARALQSDIDASSVDRALARHEALEQKALASEARAEELRANFSRLSASEREARNAVRSMERGVASARTEADRSGARAAAAFRRETERVLRSIQRTAAANQETVQAVAVEVGQERGILSVRPRRTVDDFLLSNASAEAVTLPEAALPVIVRGNPACMPCVDMPPCVAYVECP